MFIVFLYNAQDVIFHNEAYTNSGNSSADASPEYEFAATATSNAANVDGTVDSKLLSDGGSLSPQRNQSFIVAVINAIKSAAKHTVVKKELNGSAAAKMIASNEDIDESDSTEMLDSETEPCLMMENVLEDVSMPDSHSHNMVSSTGLILTAVTNSAIGHNKPVVEPPQQMAVAAESFNEVPSTNEITDNNMDRDEESIHNLSLAIFNRQQIEHQANIIMR